MTPEEFLEEIEREGIIDGELTTTDARRIIVAFFPEIAKEIEYKKRVAWDFFKMPPHIQQKIEELLEKSWLGRRFLKEMEKALAGLCKENEPES